MQSFSMTPLLVYFLYLHVFIIAPYISFLYFFSEIFINIYDAFYTNLLPKTIPITLELIPKSVSIKNHRAQRTCPEL